MKKNDDISELQAQIEVLLELNHVIAYSGELGDIKINSYVPYSDVLKILNDKRKTLAKLKKEVDEIGDLFND